mmetsp:Transcript_25934/g.72624  ORF Transcript_25934/g.72624 Transcript_25934/m.72624 type:complete len:215 (+) Transcript_25934:483-1127(+)
MPSALTRGRWRWPWSSATRTPTSPTSAGRCSCWGGRPFKLASLSHTPHGHRSPQRQPRKACWMPRMTTPTCYAQRMTWRAWCFRHTHVVWLSPTRCRSQWRRGHGGTPLSGKHRFSGCRTAPGAGSRRCRFCWLLPGPSPCRVSSRSYQAGQPLSAQPCLRATELRRQRQHGRGGHGPPSRRGRGGASAPRRCSPLTAPCCQSGGVRPCTTLIP